MSVLWISAKDRLPKAGELIAKRWKSGAMWAGKYAGTTKDSGFDEWVSLEETPSVDGVSEITVDRLVGAFERHQMGVQYFPMALIAAHKRSAFTLGSVELRGIVVAVNSILKGSK